MYRILLPALFLLLAVGSSAQAELIDTFNVGNQEFQKVGNPAAGNPTWDEFSDASILGGQRQLYGRDGHSGTLGNPTAMTVDATAGTVEFWGGATAPDFRIQYGSAINTGYPGFGPVGTGTPTNLNLNKLLTDDIQIDVLQTTAANHTDDARISVRLFTGAGEVQWDSGTKVQPGTLTIPLSAFTGITAAHAADIDGIRISSSASYFSGGAVTSAKGQGLILSEIRFGDPASTAPVPEPTSIAAFTLLGLVGFGWRRFRGK